MQRNVNPNACEIVCCYLNQGDINEHVLFIYEYQ